MKNIGIAVILLQSLTIAAMHEIERRPSVEGSRATGTPSTNIPGNTNTRSIQTPLRGPEPRQGVLERQPLSTKSGIVAGTAPVKEDVAPPAPEKVTGPTLVHPGATVGSSAAVIVAATTPGAAIKTAPEQPVTQPAIVAGQAPTAASAAAASAGTVQQGTPGATGAAATPPATSS